MLQLQRQQLLRGFSVHLCSPASIRRTNSSPPRLSRHSPCHEHTPCDNAPAPRRDISCCSYSPNAQPQNEKPKSSGFTGNGVFLLLLINVIFFILDHVLHLPFMRALYLNHASPQWWQFVTHMFCHGNLQHISSNLFHLCIFGKLVEETEGGFGVWFVYILTGLGAALATFLTSPAMHHGHATVSVGASGAVFGLFAVSVLGRLSWDMKRLLEALVLGQFVVRQVLDEVKHQVAGGLMVKGMAVSHVAHLGGALAGVLLVLALSRLPADDTSVTKPA